MNTPKVQSKNPPAQVVTVKKIKAPALLGALRHNLREIISTANEHRYAIDPGKSRYNAIIRGVRTSAEVKGLHDELKEKNDINSLRHEHVAKVINRREAVDFHHASVGVNLGRSGLWKVADVLQALEQRGLK